MARSKSIKPYDPAKERATYDDAYYQNHVKYYEKGISSFTEFLKENFEFTSIADVGCGTGAFTAPLQTDKKVFGFDFSNGSKQVSFLDHGNYYDRDLSIEGATDVARGAEIAMSLEVWEHIHPEHEMTYLKNVFGLDAKWVIISCAPPGQWGRHHYNPRTLEEVEQLVTSTFPQYEVNRELTDKFQKIKKLASFYRKNTLVFQRKDA